MQPKRSLSPQVLTLLGLLSLVVTAFVAAIIILVTGAPGPIGIAIIALLFCIDAASLAMVWYVNGRG